MNKLRKINKKNQKVELHENIIDILFQHKNEVTRILADVCGHYDIDYVSINIVNSNNKLVIFSISPSVEFNLLADELWRHDQSFDPGLYQDGTLFSWDEGYSTEYKEKLNSLKLVKHNFTFGFNLVRKINSLQIVYSFATRSKDENLHLYYQNIQSQLFLLGDFAYKLINPLYKKLGFHNILENQIGTKSCPTPLRLIVNNSTPPIYKF